MTRPVKVHRDDSKSARRSAEHGFTLIELLVALGILSLVATMLLGGMVSAGAFARRTDRNETATAEVSAAQIILRQHIESLRPAQRLDAAEPTMDIAGDDKMLDFFGAPPLGDPAGGLRKYRLMLTAAGDLVLFQAPELTDHFDLRARGVTGWKAARLLSGVRTLSLSYYGANRMNRERTWRSIWLNSGSAPELVRVRLGFVEGDPRSWPDLLIRPAVTTDLDCDPEIRFGKCGKST